jgi:putative transposase
MKDNKDVDSLSHTTWRCQYHVVFAPKYRRMVIYGQIKKDIGQILRQEYIKNQLQQD